MPPGTTLRAIRIADDLWTAAQEKAAATGRNVSEVLRDLLSTWVNNDGKDAQ